jgi:hypothetical protein
MILFKLRCGTGHEFEAWFRDGATYERQAQRGLIACPDCASKAIEKAPMAPRVARSATEKAPQPPAPEQLRQMLQQLRRHVETHCDYVGEKFAEEARRIHSGESEARGIYGEASNEDAQSLAEDGIEVARIPWVPSSDA